MSERKSYLKLLGEGFQMMKQSKQTESTIALRGWTFSIKQDQGWFVILRAKRIKWIGLPNDTFQIEKTLVKIGDLQLTRHEETNEVRLTIDEEWGLESKIVCDNLEWGKFIDALKQVKGE
ncbi:hypothetical protein [Exiguobacterium algae]|uniref:hypothetical protein n=1 Tax=Exiguobacterium algae TaxID=2751250 RepID=UPI001BE97C48|nr:hypothetical protein [Exiguobacterium algae]